MSALEIRIAEDLGLVSVADEIKRLRRALEVLADRENWMGGEWMGPFGNGYDLARYALGEPIDDPYGDIEYQAERVFGGNRA